MSTPSAPVISNAPLASPNTLEYWWYPPVSGDNIQDYYLTLTSQYGTLNCNVGSAGTYYKVTGLSNATTYFTTIAASNANGLGIVASFREFQPGSPPSNGVSSLGAVAVTLSTGAAVVSWTPPVTTPDATIFWYVISAYTSANPVTPVLKYTAGGQTQSNYFIPYLDINSNYYFTVRAVNCPGWSVPVSTNTISWFTPVPSFAPNMLSGLNIWLDGSDNNYLTLSGSNITQLLDKSGNMLNTTTKLGSVYIMSNDQNSLNSMMFNSGGFNGNVGSTTYTGTEVAGFMVGTLSNVTSSFDRIMSLGVLGTGEPGNNLYTNLMYRDSPAVSSIATDRNGSTTSQGVPANNSYFIASVAQGFNTTYINVNGLAPSITAGRATAFGYTNYGIGLGMGQNLSQSMRGKIGEWIIYQSFITPFNRQKIEGYLAWKWGLQSNLPTFHPFRTARPMSNSVFAPPMLSSLQLWLDASDRSSITTVGGVVSQWVDKTSNAYTLTQGTAGSRPTYFNSTNQITFSNNTFLNIPQASINNAATYTFFFVFTPVATSNWIMVKQYDGVNTYNALSMTNYAGTGGGKTAGTNGFLYFHPLNGVTPVSSSNALTTNTQQLISMTYDATTLTMLRNGTQMSATAGSYALPNQTSATNFTMGIWNSSGVIQDTGITNFQMNEFLFYNRGLSTQDRQTVEGYLAWKWGLQGNLPTTHPYKYNNPAIVNFTQISPSTFGGMQLWLDASQLTGLSNGGSLTTWVDRSSNAYVGGASNGPTFITNSINGLPVVRFNGSSQYINFGSNILNIGSNSGVATFAVVKFNTTGSNAVIGKTIYGPGEGRWALTRDTVSGFGMNAQFFIQSGGTATESIYADTTTTPQLIEGTWDRQNQYIYQNGLQRDSDARATMTSFNTTYPLYAGAYPNGAGSAPQYYMNGDIAEILVYMTNVTPFIRQQIEGYLTWKWGLQASLPTSHPYFTAPPQQAYTTFVPTLYSGLQAWYDAQDSATVIRTGTSVTQWNDKSGNSRNAIPYQGSNPVYATSVLNTYSAVQMTPLRALRSFTPPGTFSNGLSAFIILQKTGSANNFETIISRNGPTASIPSPFDLYNGQRLIGNGGNSGQNISYVVGTSSTDIRNLTSPTLFFFNASASGMNENTNGGTLTTPIGSTTTYGDNSSYVYIGGRDELTTSFTGNMGEILVYSGILSTDQRQTVEGYLAWKWGLQGLLPVTHPYALINPGNPAATLSVITSGLLIRFDATTYSGTGIWTNTGSLGATNNASPTGTVSKNGAGNGVVFGGSTYFTFPNISLGSVWTGIVWIKRTATPSGSPAFITQSFTGGAINMVIASNRGVADATRATGAFYDSSGTWRESSQYVDLTLSTWVQVAVTWNGSSMVTYNNGLLVGSTTLSATASDGGQQYYIGRRWDNLDYIRAELGQILIYNRALTAQEVLQNFTATSSTFSV